jgi:hypothetical protein
MKLLMEQGHVKLENYFIDGSKFEANGKLLTLRRHAYTPNTKLAAVLQSSPSFQEHFLLTSFDIYEQLKNASE